MTTWDGLEQQQQRNRKDLFFYEGKKTEKHYPWAYMLYGLNTHHSLIWSKRKRRGGKRGKDVSLCSMPRVRVWVDR